MSDHLAALRLFVRVARMGSFSRAAKELEISQPTASRMIAELEERVGATLLLRTTRAVTLTEAGEEYLVRVQAILDAMEEADEAVRGAGELRGVLRISASSIFASRSLLPFLHEFMMTHAALKVELHVDDRRQDLIGEGMDVAFRFGALSDSTALARQIGQWPILIVASPTYLERMGTPETPTGLAGHIAIETGPLAGKPWPFRKDGINQSVKVGGLLRVTASEVGVNAGVAGLGILVGSSPAYRRELERGELVRLLPDWDLGEIEAHALFPSGQKAKPAARAFVDYLVVKLREL